MAYEPKPGSFSLFKNDRKEKDSHPDYKGDGQDLEGNPIWVSAWLKDGKNGKFMSCSMTHKEQQGGSASAGTNKGSSFQDDSDLPF